MHEAWHPKIDCIKCIVLEWFWWISTRTKSPPIPRLSESCSINWVDTCDTEGESSAIKCVMHKEVECVIVDTQKKLQKILAKTSFQPTPNPLPVLSVVAIVSKHLTHHIQATNCLLGDLLSDTLNSWEAQHQIASYTFVLGLVLRHVGKEGTLYGLLVRSHLLMVLQRWRIC